jgi:ketosteroid isomerase-like protein
MAVRRKKSSRKPTRARGARKPAKKGAARKKSAQKKKTPARRKPAAAKAPAAARPPGNPLEPVARRIVNATLDPSRFVIADLYTSDCVSEEATGPPVQGHAGIEQKMKQWESMQQGTKWRPRNVFAGRNTVCIEWDCDVTLRDGRVVKLNEVAVHEIRDGKIARERYYYNPAALGPAPA